MSKRAKKSSRHTIRRLNKAIHRLENRQRKEMIALRRDVIHAVRHLLDEALPAPDGE